MISTQVSIIIGCCYQRKKASVSARYHWYDINKRLFRMFSHTHSGSERRRFVQDENSLSSRLVYALVACTHVDVTECWHSSSSPSARALSRHRVTEATAAPRRVRFRYIFTPTATDSICALFLLRRWMETPGCLRLYVQVCLYCCRSSFYHLRRVG